MPSVQDLKSLEEELASAEKKLRSTAGVGSVSSEGRDVALEGQRVKEELEWKSNASSVSLPSKHRSEEGHKSDKSSDVGSAGSGGNGKSYRQMPGRLSSRTARDREAAASSSSGLEVGLQQAAIGLSSRQTAGSGGGSAVGSGVGNLGSIGVGNSGSSASKSAARPSAEAGEGEGSGVGSATSSRSAPRGQGSSLTGSSATPSSVMLEHIPSSQKEQVLGLMADMESQAQELDDVRRQFAASEEAWIVSSESLRQEVAEAYKKMRAMKKKNAVADTVAEILAKHLELLLTDRRQADKEKSKELAEMRMRMHEMRQEKEGEIVRLTAILQIERDDKNLRLTPGPVQASPSSSSNSGPLGVASQKGKGRPGVRKPTGKGGGGMAALASIDEENSMEIASLASSSLSGQVSSDGDVNVANMDDFDEDAAKRHLMMPTGVESAEIAQALRAEIQEARDKNQELLDKDVGKDAEYWAKRERLFYQLSGLRNEMTTSRIKMAVLEKSNVDLERHNGWTLSHI